MQANKQKIDVITREKHKIISDYGNSFLLIEEKEYKSAIAKIYGAEPAAIVEKINAFLKCFILNQNGWTQKAAYKLPLDNIPADSDLSVLIDNLEEIQEKFAPDETANSHNNSSNATITPVSEQPSAKATDMSRPAAGVGVSVHELSQSPVSDKFIAPHAVAKAVEVEISEEEAKRLLASIEPYYKKLVEMKNRRESDGDLKDALLLIELLQDSNRKGSLVAYLEVVDWGKTSWNGKTLTSFKDFTAYVKQLATELEKDKGNAALSKDNAITTPNLKPHKVEAVKSVKPTGEASPTPQMSIIKNHLLLEFSKFPKQISPEEVIARAGFIDKCGNSANDFLKKVHDHYMRTSFWGSLFRFSPVDGQKWHTLVCWANQNKGNNNLEQIVNSIKYINSEAEKQNNNIEIVKRKQNNNPHNLNQQTNVSGFNATMKEEAETNLNKAIVAYLSKPLEQSLLNVDVAIAQAQTLKEYASPNNTNALKQYVSALQAKYSRWVFWPFYKQPSAQWTQFEAKLKNINDPVLNQALGIKVDTIQKSNMPLAEVSVNERPVPQQTAVSNAGKGNKPCATPIGFGQAAAVIASNPLSQERNASKGKGLSTPEPK